MKLRSLMPVLVITVSSLLLGAASPDQVCASPTETEPLQLAQNKVSPQDPSDEVPNPSMNCPHCGKLIPMGKGKGIKARPRLGARQFHQQQYALQHHGQFHDRAGRGHRHGRRAAGRHNHLNMLLGHAEALGLTEAQQEKLKDLRFTGAKEMIELKAAVQKEKLELRRLMNDEEMDARSIKRQLDAVAQAQTELKYKKVTLMIQARDVLTDEQKKLIQEKPHNWQGMFGPYGMEHIDLDCSNWCVLDEELLEIHEGHLEGGPPDMSDDHLTNE